MSEPLPHAGHAPSQTDRHIPSLDGLRAVSILLVILAHVSTSATASPGAWRRIHDFVNYGNLGVRVFFVISGFLITGLLLREWQITGRINLLQFYLRRAFRIFPAFYTYLAVILGAGALQWLPALSPSNLVHVATYTVNYETRHPNMVGHLWSLSVEEWFYLLWPPLLAWRGVRAGMRAAAAFVVLSPVLRLTLYCVVSGYHDLIGRSFETVADAIVTGCLLAYWRDALWGRAWYRQFLSSRWVAAVPFIVLAAACLDGRPRISYSVGITIKNVGIALMLDWAVRFPCGRVGRVLNARWVAFVGTMSYSLYLWQQPFLQPDRNTPWTHFPGTIAGTVLAALSSYYLVERPALRLRARLEQRWPSRPAAASADSRAAA